MFSCKIGLFICGCLCYNTTIRSVSAGFPAFFMGEQREKDNKGETEMEKFFIEGPSRLEGEVVISGAKNAAVAIIPAVLLAEEPCVLENIPNINDVNISLQILQ